MTGKRAGGSMLALIVVISLAPTPSRAVAAPKPWEKGVTAEARRRARRHFERGNDRFAAARYSEAAKDYRRALRSWRHPTVSFNLAVCLIHLERPVQARAHLAAALRYGPTPLGEGLYRQALTYRRLLDGRLTRLSVASQHAGARVFIDGKLLFVAPGRRELTLEPGQHQIVASAAGYVTRSEKLVLLPGKKRRVAITLRRVTHAVRYVRRWAWWKPWLVVGAGALLATVFVPLYLSARADYSNFDDAVTRRCPLGCSEATLSDAERAHERDGDRKYVASLSFAITGGAVAAAGAVMLLLNRLRPMSDHSSALGRVQVMAHAGRARGELAVRISF